MTSPFGEAVSLPPPAAGTRPDLALAAALAESQFSARQADELARTTEAVYQQAVNKALEASLQTANYDEILRDIKLWVIDLAASTDDVLAALDSIVRQRHDVALRLEKALESSELEYDERKIRKLSWTAEHLPSIEDKLRNLADKMTPIGVAVVELQDLRDHVLATSPPLEEAGRELHSIITRLFNTMEEAGLRPSSHSDGVVDDYNGAGPSSSRPTSPTEVQAPADLRDLVAALIDEAQKLPKRPRKKKSSGSIATSATTATTSLADPSEIRELPMTPNSGGDGDGQGSPLSIPFAASGVAAALSGVAALNLANSKREKEAEEQIQQPSAPQADLEEVQDQVELSLDVLPTPLGNDLVSFAAEEEIPNEPGVTATATVDLLRPHRLENFEKEEEEEKEQGERQQEPTLLAAATLPTFVPTHPPSSEQVQEEQMGSLTNIDNVIKLEGKKKEQTVLNKNPKTPLWRRLSTRSPATTSTPGSTSIPSSSIPSATSTPSSSRRTSNCAGTFTTPVPFQLSSSRWKAKGPSEAPTAPDTLRRLPALISLHYEMEKDSGVVADAVGWTRSSNDKTKIELGTAVALAPPAALSSSTTFESPEEMVTFVKAQLGDSFPVTVPSRFDASSRWSVTCAAAGAHEALMAAIQDFSFWEIQTTSVVSESHRLVEYLAKVTSILSTVANTHDPLRHALVKHRLPWEESLTAQVRWAAQHAGITVMSQAIEASEEAERTKGAWQRQAVLKPLGHGVMTAFSVHQLAGGFGTEAAAVCDYLVERTVHYARMIDPKWFRGHKVVSS
jgi:hypothetical protein